MGSGRASQQKSNHHHRPHKLPIIFSFFIFFIPIIIVYD